MFAWPVSSLLAILHVNLWIPDHDTDSSGYMALMNVMCDMIQCVVVVPVPDESSATLASYFMQYVLLEFDLYYLVVLDDGNPFKGSFIAMCKNLNINHDVLAKSSHKDITIEHFHLFLNKSVTIATGERDINDIFCYCWRRSHGSCFVKKLHKPDSSELNCMTYDLYSLPPSLKSYEPIDKTKTRCLNQSHAPFTNPLKKSIHTELYNEKWFNKPLPTSIPPSTYQHHTLKMPTAPFPALPSVIELHEKTHTCPLQPLFEKVDDIFSNPLSPIALHKSLATTDCLFFIQYIPDITIKPRWFLI